MPILASEALVCEKKIPVWSQVQHAPLYTDTASAT